MWAWGYYAHLTDEWIEALRWEELAALLRMPDVCWVAAKLSCPPTLGPALLQYLRNVPFCHSLGGGWIGKQHLVLCSCLGVCILLFSPLPRFY